MAKPRWLRSLLQFRDWQMFAAGALLMLGAWHLREGQVFKIPVDLLLCIFFVGAAKGDRPPE